MILNLTQHPATPDQLAQGVVDLSGEALERLRGNLTFATLEEAQDAAIAAWAIANLAEAHGAKCAMIGGAPWLMGELERALLKRGIQPVYSFSTREVVEQTQEDGSVRKVAVFRHQGWVEVTE